jgi:hypothetical protein
VSIGFLKQGLAAAYRGGLLCRLPTAERLQGVSGLDELFPSVSSLGAMDPVRVAVWPAGQPELELMSPDEDAGEMLPRVVLRLPDLGLDLYVPFEGMDVRLLGLTADVTLQLAPGLEDHKLHFELREATVRELHVGFSKLLGESTADLESAAAEATERIMKAMVDSLQPLELPRPPAGAGGLLGTDYSEGRLLFYFSP